MLEMCLQDSLTLGIEEYRRYVEDRWDWSSQFKLSNSAYVSSAASSTYLNNIQD